MNKRLRNRCLTILLPFLAAFTVLLGQVLIFLFGENYGRSPAYFGVYRDSGYYEINPEKILASIEQDETDIFVPFYGDIDRDEPYYDSIAWKQSDYLKIVNALSAETWNEPLNLEDWQVIFIDLIGDCHDEARGFHTFTITYYKALGIENWERRYVTRLIEIYPWQGLIRWGKDATFSAPLLLPWDGFSLTEFRITGDDALQIAERNGGVNARQKIDDSCMTVLTVNQLSPLPHRVNWLVDYERADFYLHINPYTGEYKKLNSDK